ncbi:MAG: ThiF family adenylyltransferase [Myxococcales bacterium]|jgi:molybdopterin/thiamine biosynthesis adenylyltransferase
MQSNDRYIRHQILAEIGPEGQRRISAASVLLVGCGALGSSQAQMLARAGIGRLRIVDRDLVEVTNLQRQILFDEDDAAALLPKAVAAQRKLARINTEIEIEARVADVNAGNIESLLAGCDLVLDACDNLETRYLVNDACVRAGEPWVYGGVVGTSGMVMAVRPGDGPCLRCLFPELPPPGTVPSCEVVGVLNAAPVVIGALQAVEALKLLAGGAPKSSGVLTLDLWRQSFQKVAVARDERCPCCSQRRFDFLEAPKPGLVRAIGRDAVQLFPDEADRPSLPALAERLAGLGRVSGNEHLLRFENGQHTLLVFADGRVVVKGTADIETARQLRMRLLAGLE